MKKFVAGTVLQYAEYQGDVLPIVGSDKLPVLFLADKSEIWSLALDEDFQQMHEYVIPKSEVTFHTLIGYTTRGYDHHLFFTNGKKNQFMVQTIDVGARKSSSKVLGIKLKGEKILEAISYGGKFYVLTVKKQTSILGLYEFEAGELTERKTYDFSNYRFQKGPKPDLYATLVKVKSTLQTELAVSQIDIRNPIPLEMGAEESKLYVLNDKIYITIDNAPGFTKMITLDLTTYEHAFDLIGNGSKTCVNVKNRGSNSFLTSEALYQIVACKSGISLRIKDLETTELITEYAVTSDEEITFKNGPAKQEGSIMLISQGKNKEIEETNELLRKMSSSEIGLSVYQTPGRVTVTIGGFREENHPPPAQIGSPIGTTISTPYGEVYSPPTQIPYNPAMDSYVSYATTRAVYFKSVLDASSYEHLGDEVGDTAYDKIKDFEESISKMTLQTVFRVGDAYLFGYFDKKKKIYALHKFLDD